MSRPYKLNSGKYEWYAATLGAIADQKNQAYGSSFDKCGEVLKILYPNGIAPEQYADLLTITRLLDKVFRVCSKKDAYGESPWADAANYCMMAAYRDHIRNGLKEISNIAAEEPEHAHTQGTHDESHHNED